MGMGLGGNKLRKLEYLIADAIQQGADVLITSGGVQSNHARLTAVAAGYADLDYELVLAHVVPLEGLEYDKNGNILLEQILGAKVHNLPKGTDTKIFIEDRIKVLKGLGKKPYLIPLGGSSAIGCLGYVNCFNEIIDQSNQSGIHFSNIIVPNGSGGTQAGLVAGLKLSGLSNICISSYTVLSQLAAAQSITHEKVNAVLNLLDPELKIGPDEILIDPHFLGEGYGISTTAMIEAVKLLARTEGIFLDPVYSGKAFAGLLADINAGKFNKGDKILFILTGGIPGLFAYRSAFDE
ncbi:MAG: pyridoxal-phosphate dependent enzyme family protein [Mucilaginibacter sp.]|nr:pyridoxal-phosphate dependent enzyme family protein [Mucilaginibacter sp.]